MAGFCSTMSFGQTATSQYTAAYDGYNYVGDWADCIGPRSIGGGSSGKADVLGYDATEGALTITSVSGHGAYSRSATYIPMVDGPNLTYSPGPVCTGTSIMPGLDISGVAANKKKMVVIVKAVPALNTLGLRLYVGQGQDGASICANNNTGSTDFTGIGTTYDTITLDLSVSGNLTSNGSCASAPNYDLPLNALTYFGFSTDVAGGTYAGTIYIKQVAIGNTDLLSNTTGVTTSVNNSLISVYPNPAKDQINVDLSSLNANDATVKIMNSNGMVVYEKAAVNSNEVISTASFNKGMYMVQVSAGNKISNKKLVIE